MQISEIESIRCKVRNRLGRINSDNPTLFHYSLLRFWDFLRTDPLTLGILQELDAKCDDSVKADVARIFSNNESIVSTSEHENDLFSYLVVKLCAESTDNEIECKVGQVFTLASRYAEILSVFCNLFLLPFAEHIDESLDSKRAVLSTLLRYKHRCEWFDRKKLYELWQEDTSAGEESLVLDMYKYLYDQGVEFSIEPTSASGKVDLILSQSCEAPLIVDGKIFNPEKSKGRSYISRGFNQVYSYTLDYNESVGYLVIFNTSDTDLHFALEGFGKVPCFMHNGKTIFFLTIELCQKPSASKRGNLRSIQITANDLVQWVQASDFEQSDAAN